MSKQTDEAAGRRASEDFRIKSVCRQRNNVEPHYHMADLREYGRLCAQEERERIAAEISEICTKFKCDCPEICLKIVEKQ